MRIACLSYFLPWSENRHGPNALLDQLLRERGPDVQVDLFVPFELLNEQERHQKESIADDLGVTLRDWASLPSRAAPAWWPAGARQLHGRPLPDLSAYDAVWGYPYWTSPLLRGRHRRVVISGMDSATLLYWRQFKTMAVQRPRAAWRSLAGLVVNTAFEACFLRGQVVHTVGRQDAEVLARLGAQSSAQRHPWLHYPLAEEAWRRPRQGPLTVLVSNAGDAFYGSRRVHHWMEELALLAHAERPIHLRLHRAAAAVLEQAQALSRRTGGALSVERLGWCDDYSALLASIDLQLFPLDIGAGTKTSLLTALQHGVVCVGTPVALENIDLQGSPDLAFPAPQSGDVKPALAAAITRAEALRQGRSALPRDLSALHAPQGCAEQFWKLFRHDA